MNERRRDMKIEQGRPGRNEQAPPKQPDPQTARQVGRTALRGPARNVGRTAIRGDNRR